KDLKCLKLSFNNTSVMVNVRRELQKVVQKNRAEKGKNEVYSFQQKHSMEYDYDIDIYDCIIDLKEYDLPYPTRVAIDMDIFVGSWYEVSTPSVSESTELGCVICKKLDMVEKP